MHTLITLFLNPLPHRHTSSLPSPPPTPYTQRHPSRPLLIPPSLPSTSPGSVYVSLRGHPRAVEYHQTEVMLTSFVIVNLTLSPPIFQPNRLLTLPSRYRYPHPLLTVVLTILLHP